MSKIRVPEPKEVAREKLLYKLDRWLRQQGEYPILFLDDRQTRRQISKEIARRVMTIPTKEAE